MPGSWREKSMRTWMSPTPEPIITFSWCAVQVKRLFYAFHQPFTRTQTSESGSAAVPTASSSLDKASTSTSSHAKVKNALKKKSKSQNKSMEPVDADHGGAMDDTFDIGTKEPKEKSGRTQKSGDSKKSSALFSSMDMELDSLSDDAALALVTAAEKQQSNPEVVTGPSSNTADSSSGSLKAPKSGRDDVIVVDDEG